MKVTIMMTLKVYLTQAAAAAPLILHLCHPSCSAGKRLASTQLISIQVHTHVITYLQQNMVKVRLVSCLSVSTNACDHPWVNF